MTTAFEFEQLSLCMDPPAPRACALDRRAGRPRGAVRTAVAHLVASGICAPLDVLAEKTGWPPESVRQAVYEMRRSGELSVAGQARKQGQAGRQPALYAAAQPVDQLDVLAFARAAWR